jgi:hypothetical protein
MKRSAAVLVALLVLTSACAGTMSKNFKVYTEPADAVVTVISGPDLRSVRYRSPAVVKAEVPNEPALAAKAVLEISRDSYITRIIALRDIENGQTLNIKLERSRQPRFRLVCRLVSPAQSETLQFRDKNLSVVFSVTDQAFQMQFENLTSAPVKILWAQAQYLDAREQPQALMHSGIRFQDRNNPIPDQIVQPKAVMQVAVFPIRNVVVTGGKPPYEIKRLIPIESDAAEGLKGKTLTVFLPIGINRAIIPYAFKMQIVDVVQEEVNKQRGGI